MAGITSHSNFSNKTVYAKKRKLGITLMGNTLLFQV